MLTQENSGPIPGANFTSDTRNYPWHQPPEFTDLNKALDMLSKKVTKFSVANGLMTIVELGVPLYRVSSMLLMHGVSEGKWTPDFALLLAGPLTRMIELICQQFEVKYEIGIEEDEDDFTTGEFFKKDNDLRAPKSFKLLEESMPEIKEEASSQDTSATDTAGGSEGDLQTKGFMAMQGSPPEAG